MSDAAAPPLAGDIAVDVAIIGAGMVGTVAARLLKDRGHSVCLFDSGRAGHGATGRSTAKVTAQHALFLQRIEKDHGESAARAYATANRMGVDLVADLVRRYGLACDHEQADSFVYAVHDAAAHRLEKEREAAERAGLPMDIVTRTELPFPVLSALRLPGQAQIQPAEFVAQLAATVAGDGSYLFENTPAVEWSETSVRTPSGSVAARQVIMATHLPLGQMGQLHAHNAPHMHPVLAVPVDPARVPAGMYISADEPKRSLRRHFPGTGEAMLILTGPTFKHGDAAAEEHGFAQLEAFARKHFGCAGGGFRWSNEDYTPRHGLPYVGWSGAAGKSLLVATGFDAWGLSNGAAAGLILAALVEGRETEWARPFDASRHLLTGLSKLAADAAKMAGELIGGHVQSRPGLSPSEASEGDIVDIGGRAAGVYRGERGTARAVSAVCTHMGCVVGWNPVDRTWDCPCHGSRFASDGRVLHGPATEPLASIAWADQEEEAGK